MKNKRSSYIVHQVEDGSLDLVKKGYFENLRQ